MFESNAKIVKVCVMTAILVLFSTNSVAEIYKWRNARGVVQYSDRPPLAGFTKATRNEVVSALQSKDVCNLPVNNTNAGTVNTGGSIANFFGRITKRNNNATANLPSKTRPIFLAANRPIAAGSPAQAQTLVASTPAPKPLANTPAATNASPVAAKPAIVDAVKPAIVDAAPKQSLAQAAPTAVEITPITPTAPAANPTAANIVQVALMPAVDIIKNIPQAIGYTELRAQATTEQPVPNGGAFRVVCTPSHMSNDDPIVYPNQSGAAHHHTFYGNTSTSAKSDLMNFSNTGNSTCNGGIMNRSAYWVPSMIDTLTHMPLAADLAIFYYKVGNIPANQITVPPKGLRMISGNSKATDGISSTAMYSCYAPEGVNKPFYGWKKSIPNCDVGDKVEMMVIFPQCWDGVNLDSPNHKDHMAFSSIAGCPATHPIAIPQVTINVEFTVKTPNQATNWRLASDNYASSTPGGYSAHADWVNGWDEKIMTGFIKNCLNKGLDCHAHLLGDGRMFF